MKRILKKAVHKPESERSKKEKLVRDIAFFGVVIYAAVMTFLFVGAEADHTEAMAKEVALNSQLQVAMMR